MVVRNIEEKIICEYKDDCKSYNCSSNKSICPTCRNNKYISPMDLKKDYYEPKSRLGEILLTFVGLIVLAVLIF